MGRLPRDGGRALCGIGAGMGAFGKSFKSLHTTLRIFAWKRCFGIDLEKVTITLGGGGLHQQEDLLWPNGTESIIAKGGLLQGSP